MSRLIKVFTLRDATFQETSRAHSGLINLPKPPWAFSLDEKTKDEFWIKKRKKEVKSVTTYNRVLVKCDNVSESGFN